MKKLSRQGLIILTIVASLILLRALAPYALTYYLNEHRLVALGEYTGHVESVDLALWRGAYRIKNLQVEKGTGAQRVDFLQVPVAEISLSWHALLRGRIRSELHLHKPQLNFVDGDTPAERQSGAGFQWNPSGIIDFVFEKITIHQGTIAFRNFTSDPPVNLQAKQINLTATNLTNIADEQGRRVANLDVQAVLFNSAPFSAKAEFDPFVFTSFLFACEMEVKDLTEINDFANAYANLDFKSGQGNLVMELQAEETQLSGYIKPAFENIDVFNWEQDVVDDEDANPFQALWEGMVGGLSALFSNPRTDALATRIDISGQLPDKASFDTWQAIGGILRNAFVETIHTHFEHLTPLTEEVEADNAEADDAEDDPEDDS